MIKPGQPFTYGIFTVKQGKESAFIAAWEGFARQTMIRYKMHDGDVRMVQNLDNPRQFLTCGAWESTEIIQKWRNSSEFKDFMAKLRDLCDEIKPYDAKLIIELHAEEVIEGKFRTM